MKWKSIACWPETVTGLSDPNNESTDTHDTREQAEAVCSLLRRFGFGGNCLIFPLETRVESVFKLGDRVKVVRLSDDQGDASFVGQTGVIAAESEFCDDSFYTVRLPDGRKDGFWPEELEAAP